MFKAEGQKSQDLYEEEFIETETKTLLQRGLLLFIISSMVKIISWNVTLIAKSVLK